MRKSEFEVILDGLQSNVLNSIDGRDSRSIRSAASFAFVSSFGELKTRRELNPPDQSDYLISVKNKYNHAAASRSVSPKNSCFTLTKLKRELVVASSVEELRNLRRKFAFDRHPDRLPPHKRSLATIEMTKANDLIDRAIETILLR